MSYAFVHMFRAVTPSIVFFQVVLHQMFVLHYCRRWTCTIVGWWQTYPSYSRKCRWWPTWTRYAVRLSANEHSNKQHNFNVLVQLHLCTYRSLMYTCGTVTPSFWCIDLRNASMAPQQQQEQQGSCTVLQFHYRRANERNFSVLLFTSYWEHLHRLNISSWQCLED